MTPELGHHSNLFPANEIARDHGALPALRYGRRLVYEVAEVMAAKSTA
jgi:hypothetical protein